MAKTHLKTTNRQLSTLAKKAQRDLADLPIAIKEIADVLAINAEVMRIDCENRKREMELRVELAKLEQDAAIVCEMTARQSAYLARTIQRIEQRSGVALSPIDLLCGILNGIQESGMDLSHFGTREEVSGIVKRFINIAQQEIRSSPDE